MLYDIGLRIRYDYQTPAAGGRHVLCMTPADLADQRPITSLLDITPAPDERIAKRVRQQEVGADERQRRQEQAGLRGQWR